MGRNNTVEGLKPAKFWLGNLIDGGCNRTDE